MKTETKLASRRASYDGLRRELPSYRAELAALASEVDEVRGSAKFLRFLDTCSRFWRYSPFNQRLIRLQRPRAKLVAGLRTWASVHRKLRPGETPILILAPSRGGGSFFVPVDVYDVAQTQGRALATLDLELSGRAPQVRFLERAAEALKIRVERLPRGSPVLGVSLGKVIRVRRGLSQLERAATLAHELAHELLHKDRRGLGRDRKHRPPRAVRETEADATAYVVMKALGLPSKAANYIAWQGGTGDGIGASLGRIQRAAREILVAARVDPLVFSTGFSRKRGTCRDEDGEPFEVFEDKVEPFEIYYALDYAPARYLDITYPDD